MQDYPKAIYAPDGTMRIVLGPEDQAVFAKPVSEHVRFDLPAFNPEWVRPEELPAPDEPAPETPQEAPSVSVPKGIPYPRARYSAKSGAMRIVLNEDEERALGPEWSDVQPDVRWPSNPNVADLPKPRAAKVAIEIDEIT